MEFSNENVPADNTPNGFPPKTWLVESILVTLFCCMPLGIVAIINSASVESKFYRGDIQGADRAAQMAKTMVLIAAISGFVGVFIYILFFGGMALLGMAS